MRLVYCLICIGCFSHSLDAQPAFFRKDISIGDGPGPIIVGDFNGDGRPDLAFRSWACRLPSSLSGPYQRCPTGTVGGVITVLLNAAAGNFGPPDLRQFLWNRIPRGQTRERHLHYQWRARSGGVRRPAGNTGPGSD